MLGSPESFRIAKSKEEKAKEKVKMDSKELVRHTVKNKLKTLNGGRNKIVLGGPGVKKSRKGSSKGNDGFQKSGFRTNPPEKGTGNDFHPHKGRGKDQKRKDKEGAYPQSELSASETPSEEGYGHTWESDDRCSSLSDNSSTSAAGWCGTGHSAWMAAVPLDLANHPTHVVLDHGCTRSNWIKSGNQKGYRNMRCITALRQSFAVVKILSCLPTLRRRLVGEAALSIFPQHLRVQPE